MPASQIWSFLASVEKKGGWGGGGGKERTKTKNNNMQIQTVGCQGIGVRDVKNVLASCDGGLSQRVFG